MRISSLGYMTDVDFIKVSLAFSGNVACDCRGRLGTRYGRHDTIQARIDCTVILYVIL